MQARKGACGVTGNAIRDVNVARAAQTSLFLLDDRLQLKRRSFSCPCLPAALHRERCTGRQRREDPRSAGAFWIFAAS